MKEETNTKKTKKKKLNKKAVILLIIVLVVVTVIVSCMILMKKENKAENIIPEISSVVKDSTTKIQEGVSINDIKIEAQGSQIIVKAKITNTGNTIKSVTPTLYVYSGEKLLRGTIQTKLEDLQQNQSKDISLEIVGDYAELNQFEIKLLELQR